LRQAIVSESLGIDILAIDTLLPTSVWYRHHEGSSERDDMKCSYHPEREPVGACVSCGRLACAECRVILGGKVYCNPCTDAFITRPTTPRGSSWFRRHLNWTMVLAWPAGFVVAFIVVMIIWGIDLYASDAQVEVMSSLSGAVVVCLIWGWALRQKNRSLAWLLLGIFVPFGWIALLCLDNRSQLSGTLELRE